MSKQKHTGDLKNDQQSTKSLPKSNFCVISWIKGRKLCKHPGFFSGFCWKSRPQGPCVSLTVRRTVTQGQSEVSALKKITWHEPVHLWHGPWLICSANVLGVAPKISCFLSLAASFLTLSFLALVLPVSPAHFWQFSWKRYPSKLSCC